MSSPSDLNQQNLNLDGKKVYVRIDPTVIIGALISERDRTMLPDGVDGFASPQEVWAAAFNRAIQIIKNEFGVVENWHKNMP